ncbi:MAG: glycosyltransferase family 2 protein, partial [Roseobacter sp.]
MSHPRPVVVLTPVKNEAHILRQFIESTLNFADYIVIADQNSSDGSVAIAEEFDQVLVIENKESLFDNAARSSLLVAKARSAFGADSILFGVDADEIFIESPQSQNEIDQIRDLPRGTTIMVDKPSLIGSTDRVIYYGSVFPLGYVDDGSEYSGTTFHSRRVPSSEGAQDFHSLHIRFLHLDALSFDEVFSKRRLYSVREVDNGGIPLRVRWRRNARRFIKKPEQHVCKPDILISETVVKMKLDCQSIRRPRPLWWDLEVLKRFEKNGFRRYFF